MMSNTPPTLTVAQPIRHEILRLSVPIIGFFWYDGLLHIIAEGGDVFVNDPPSWYKVDGRTWDDFSHDPKTVLPGPVAKSGDYFLKDGELWRVAP